jgi:hypothetical protein
MTTISTTRHFLTISVVAACVLSAGCARQPTVVPGLPDALREAAEAVGRRVAADLPEGRVLFLHAELSKPLAAAMREGLRKGLGSRLSLEEMGPEQLPGDLPLLPAADVLAEALKQHGETAAIVSALAISDASAGRVPADIPPLYILNWQNPSLYREFLRHPRCRGGMFYSRGETGPVFTEVRGGA